MIGRVYDELQGRGGSKERKRVNGEGSTTPCQKGNPPLPPNDIFRECIWPSLTNI